MGHAIDIDEIPGGSAGGTNAWLMDEVHEFEESGERAWELKQYETTNSARSTVSRLNAQIREEGLPIEALSRGLVVYLKRTDLDETPKPPRKKKVAR